jgi:hypothetical protein
MDWDTAVLRSTVDGRPYQEGATRALSRTVDVLALFDERSASHEDRDRDIAIFGGTVPVAGGAFTPGRRWSVSLTLADGRAIEHAYEVTVADVEVGVR